MRYVVFLLFVSLATRVLGRPPITDEVENSEGEDAEYETGGDEGEVEESLQEDSEGRLEEVAEEEEPQQNQHPREPARNTFPQRLAEEHSSRANDDNFPGYKANKNRNGEEEAVEETNANSEYEAPTKQRDSNRYIEKLDDQPETVQHANEENNFKSLHNNDKIPIGKRNPNSGTSSDLEGDLLFESNENSDQQVKNDKTEYNNEVLDAQPRYSRKYYNTLQENAQNDKRFQDHLNLNRDRRAVQDTNETTVHLASSNIGGETAEDEEAAIKRHVKKLSSQELDELLNSLSEDKRELLKKIMENDAGSDNDINKREITKKAGAAPDENGNLDSQLSEASKLQETIGGDTNSQTSSTELTETNKHSNPQSEINILPVTKTLDASNSSSSSSSINNNENKLELIGHDAGRQDKSDSASSMSPVDSNQDKNDINVQEPPKSESKREANSEDLTNVDDVSFDDTKFLESSDFKDSQDLSNEPGYFCVQDEDFSQFIDDAHGNNNIMKREAYLAEEAELSESMKSLEESFPNSNSYDDNDPYSGSDMAPLVRVKRKNTDPIIKKRAAGILPDAKVAFVPYRAENDDEDNDEGNEFDDDGFYDRTSNLAKSDSKDTLPEELSISKEGENQQLRDAIKNPEDMISRSKLTQNNLQSDTMNLGSDTDSVLSGVEGVDDNLMYNSGSRNRRTADEKLNENEQDQKLSRPLRSTPMAEDNSVKSVSENYMSVPNYHENDAFGPLPRSYEGELGRYKRIRRVKQPASQNVGSN